MDGAAWLTLLDPRWFAAGCSASISTARKFIYCSFLLGPQDGNSKFFGLETNAILNDNKLKSSKLLYLVVPSN